MIGMFQIFQTMIDNLDLLFYNRHPLGKVVMESDFSGQLIYLGIGNSL